MCKIFVLLLAMLFMGCNQSSSDSQSPSDSNIDMPLSSEFTIKDKFGQEVNLFTVGEEISFEIRVENTTNKDVTYQATGPGYDFVVKQGETQIWSKHYGLFFAQIIADRVIKASEVLVLSATWSGNDNERNVVSAGEYKVSPNLVFFVNGNLVPEPEPKVIILN
ncbi:MAG: hypothetical protein GY928_26220 [Colwellia sp.]|nr:hypothetical protein [Colwellia sp.]